MVEELTLGVGRVQDSQQLREAAQSVRGQTALLVPEAVHFESEEREKKIDR